MVGLSAPTAARAVSMNPLTPIRETLSKGLDEGIGGHEREKKSINILTACTIHNMITLST